jgi:hypothetical protein
MQFKEEYKMSYRGMMEGWNEDEVYVTSDDYGYYYKCDADYEASRDED